MQSQEARLLFKVDADTGRVVVSVKEIKNEVSDLGPAGQQAGRQASAGMDQIKDSTVAAGNAVQTATRLVVAFAGAFTVRELIQFNQQVLRLAIDAQETANKFDVVFRGSIEETRAELRLLTNTIPLTLTEMQGLSAGVQDLLVPLGLARNEAAGLSVQAVELAGDLASFNNSEADEALNAIKSSLVGSSEPMRSFGVDTRETRLQTIALNQGLIKQGEELSGAARAHAVFAAIVADSSDAIGDAERTVNSAANGLRFIQQDIRETGEAIGNEMLPQFEGLIATTQQFTSGLSDNAEEIVEVGQTLLQVGGGLVVLFGARLTGSLAATSVQWVINTQQAIAYQSALARMAGVSRVAATSQAVLRSSLAFIGGPAGLAFIAGASLLAFGTDAFSASGDVRKLDDEIESLLSNMDDLARTRLTDTIDGAFTRIDELQERAKQLNAELAQEQQQPTVLRRIQGGDVIEVANPEIPRLRAQLEDLAQQTIQYTTDAAALQQKLTDVDTSARNAGQGIATISLGDISDDTKALSESLREANDEFYDLLNQANDALDALADGNERQSASLNGPLAEAQLEHKRRLEGIADVEQRLIELGTLDINAQRDIQQARQLSAEVLDEAIAKQRESFESLVDGLGEAITAYEGGEQALEAYNKAQFIFQETSALGADATEDQIQKVTELAGKLYDARDAARSLGDEFLYVSDSAIAIINSIRGIAGSEREYQAIEVAVNALALAQGISAIVNQGQGDPYSAPARMLAMAAIVAPLLANLGQSIGSLGGSGFTDVAGERQATQGTGGVLGDIEADSQSITNSLETTADATSQLVGINRGMLRALQTLNQAIGSASGQIARGAADSDFPTISGKGAFDGISSFLNDAVSLGGVLDPLGILDGISKLLGGRSKVVDQGISILSGPIADLIDGSLIGTFQTVQSKAFFFSSAKTREQTGEIGDELAVQLGLVFESIIDSVVEASLALGIDATDIESRIAAFRVEEQKISLKDLSADEQKAELQAVFSSIFDGLAGDVAPFIEQFQQVGEGLGETLIRVATGVQVTQEAIRRLGFIAANETPEQFAQLSEALIEASGGLEQFIGDFTNFFDNFAPDDAKFAAAESDINRAFEQLGLTIPATREALFELVQTLDANTEAGIQQISTIIGLTDAADTYFNFLEEREQQRVQDARELNDLLLSVSADIDGITQVANAYRDSLRSIDEAYEADIARAKELGATEEQLAIIRRRHQLQIQQLTAELRASIADLTAQIFGGGDSLFEATNSFAGATSQVASAAQDLSGVADSLRATADGLLTNAATSPFDATERRDILEAQFEAALAARDFGRANSLAGQLAAAIREVGSSSSDADQRILVLRQQLLSAADSIGESGPPTRNQVSNIVDFSRDIASQAFEQTQLAAQLVERIGFLSDLTRQSGLDFINEYGIPLNNLVEILGIDLQNLNADTTSALGGLAESFNISIADLTNELGVNIGLLTDATSILNDSLEAAIDRLPANIAGPLLDQLAVAEATGDVSGLEAAVADLPIEYANQLAPFLDGISVVSQVEATNLLLVDSVTELENIKNLMTSLPDDIGDIPGAINDLGGLISDEFDGLGNDILQGLSNFGDGFSSTRFSESDRLVFPVNVPSSPNRSGSADNQFTGDSQAMSNAMNAVLEELRRSNDLIAPQQAARMEQAVAQFVAAANSQTQALQQGNAINEAALRRPVYNPVTV